jgi:hypothetical protein
MEAEGSLTYSQAPTSDPFSLFDHNSPPASPFSCACYMLRQSHPKYEGADKSLAL